MFKQRFWEEFGRRLDSNYSSANKVLWQTIRRLRVKRFSTATSIKDSSGNILTEEKEILSRGREYFKDLLNPIKTKSTDKWNSIDVEKEKVSALTEVAAAIRRLKSEKAAGEDEARPKILKALNGGVRCLARVYQVAWELGKHQKTGKQV